MSKFLITEMYENGYGVTQNHGKAIEWYKKAASNGNTDAKSILAALAE